MGWPMLFILFYTFHCHFVSCVPPPSRPTVKLRSQIFPKTFIVAPSQYWDGVDGYWSSFGLLVGSPPQQVRVLPATGLSSVWVVHPDGCTADDLPDCPQKRGFTFNSNKSTSWREIGLFQMSLLAEERFGMSGNAYYGYDSIKLGWPGSGAPTVSNRVIGAIATKDVFVGALPLSPLPINFTDFNHPQTSLLTELKRTGIISSLTWGYTAGLYSNSPPVFGSLTFGGYDTSRIDQSSRGLTVNFGDDVSEEFTIAVQDLTVSFADGNKASITSIIGGFFASINTKISAIWLPPSYCVLLEKLLGIEYDKDWEMYFISDDLHNRLSNTNPVFKFRFSPALENWQARRYLDISIPYSSLVYEAREPFITGVPSRYLLIRKLKSNTKAALGRVALQHLYLFSDYERRRFTIYPALLPNTTYQKNRPVGVNPVSVGVNVEDAEHKSRILEDLFNRDEKIISRLRVRAVVGITFGTLAGVLTITGVAAFFIRRRMFRKKKQMSLKRSFEKKSSSDSTLENSSLERAKLSAEAEKQELDAVDAQLKGTCELDHSDRSRLLDSSNVTGLKKLTECDSSELALTDAAEMDGEGTVSSELPTTELMSSKHINDHNNNNNTSNFSAGELPKLSPDKRTRMSVEFLQVFEMDAGCDGLAARENSNLQPNSYHLDNLKPLVDLKVTGDCASYPQEKMLAEEDDVSEKEGKQASVSPPHHHSDKMTSSIIATSQRRPPKNELMVNTVLQSSSEGGGDRLYEVSTESKSPSTFNSSTPLL